MPAIPEGFPASYIPESLPPKSLDLSKFFDETLKATEAIARYDGILHNMINPDLILATLTPREAVLSSKIEGTFATLEEVMIYDAQSFPNKRDQNEVKNDVREVHNYILAMRQAMMELKKRPFCINTMCALHCTLLTGVRGQDKRPGEIRTTQNLVRTEYGRFTPPDPTIVRRSLDNWEMFLHTSTANWLIQLALLKAQFELIHPFLDGNGRIGRMLVPLILYSKKHIKSPTFYISDYLTRNEGAYYESLSSISKNKNWDGWIKFFLLAVTEQSKINSNKAISINGLYDETKSIVDKVAPSKHSIRVVDALFSNPYFDTNYFVHQSKIPRSRAYELLQRLNESEILEVLQPAAGSRPAVFVFPKLFSIINDIDAR